MMVWRDKMGAECITGWEHEKRAHFDEIVENYDRIRPDYPDRLFADVLGSMGSGRKKALEIGPGTGKATAPFLRAGYDVTAVEIGENMAEFLRDRFREQRDFRVIVSAFEDAELDEGGYDLIYAGSAFHWVNAEIGCPKAYRLLKGGGLIALFRYNLAVWPDGDEFADEIHAVREKYYFSYYPSKERSGRRSHGDFAKPSEILNNYGFEDLRGYGYKEVSLKLYDETLTFTADEYIAILDTLADHRSLPEDNRAALYAGIREVILRHGGLHSLDYIFQLYTGRK